MLYREAHVLLEELAEAVVNGTRKQYVESLATVPLLIIGCNWGGSMLKAAYLGREMHLEYRHPEYKGPIVTLPIVDIRLLPKAA